MIVPLDIIQTLFRSSDRWMIPIYRNLDSETFNRAERRVVMDHGRVKGT